MLNFSELHSGSSSIIFCASSRAICTICPSRAISAIFKSKAIPLCWVPSRSPGPRNFKSASAIRNPSLVSHIMSIRLRVSSLSLKGVTRMQYDWSAPRPTRPRSWCNWANPKRWASRITITEALGTFTPTSITVVATSIWVSLRTKRCISSSLSFGFIRPWTLLRRNSGNASRNTSKPSSRFFKSLLALSSIRGNTM